METGIIPSSIWALDTEPSHSFGRFFTQLWAVFLHTCTDQVLLSTSRDRALFVQFLPFWSSVLRTETILSSLTQVLLQAPSGLVLLLWYGSWNSPAASSIYFLFLRDHVIHGLMFRSWKPASCIYYFYIFGCFKWEINLVPVIPSWPEVEGLLIILFKTNSNQK